MHRKYVKPGKKYDLGKFSEDKSQSRECYIYCRVSSVSQRDDLKRQVQCMSEQYPGFSVLSDIASGINFKRRSLQSLLEKVMRGTVEKIVVSHRDRLARFGFELIEFICKSNGCERMKMELAARESLQIPINDPEEIKKIERKEELRRNRELKKSLTTTSSKSKVTPGNKQPKRDPTQTVTKSFSVRIKPSKDQKQILNHWIGCARFTYNQGLSIVKEYTSRDSKSTINESLFQTIKGQVVPYDKVDRDKPWLHNCPEKIRAYAVHKELYRTYKSNFAKGGHRFEPKFRNRRGLQSIHMPKDKVLYCRETRKFRLFPNVLDKSGYSKSRFDVTFVRTASHKYEMRLTFDEDLHEVQERNQSKTPSKKFDSIFIDPGNRTFSTMYSPEGFAGSVGDKDVSRIFRLLKTHDKLQTVRESQEIQ